VLAHSVAQRTHEIGIRMALGAQPANVLRLVVWQGMRLVLLGMALGLGGAFWLTGFLESWLFETKPVDPLIFTGVAFVLVLVVLVACYIPARRATRVDPMIALRCE
jgi:putative ABC transport system permease protein